ERTQRTPYPGKIPRFFGLVLRRFRSPSWPRLARLAGHRGRSAVYARRTTSLDLVATDPGLLRRRRSQLAVGGYHHSPANSRTEIHGRLLQAVPWRTERITGHETLQLRRSCRSPQSDCPL